MHINKIIQNLGYSSSETKVYLSVLELGASKISDIALKAGLPRTTVQEIVQKLRRDGLMYPATHQSHKSWIAENPNKLLTILREREGSLQAILPDLQALRNDVGDRPVVRILSGTKEISRLFEDILETKHHMLAIVSWDDWVALFGKEFVDDFVTRRTEHFLKIKLLTTRTSLSRELKKHDDEQLRITRFLSDDQQIHTSNFIYGNKVAIISLNKKLPVATLIEDEDISNTMRVLFEALWQKNEIS